MYITLHQIYILNCINLLVGTISLRSLGENTLVGTLAFLHSDHWAENPLSAHRAEISSSVHWAEISLRQHRLVEQLKSRCSIQMHGCPGKTGSILCFSMVIKSGTVYLVLWGIPLPVYPFG